MPESPTASFSPIFLRPVLKASSGQPSKPKKGLLFEKNESTEPQPKSEKASIKVEKVQPKKTGSKKWTPKNKDYLESAFNTYNPHTDEDWEKVQRVLPADWTIDELKAQAKKMNLKPTCVVKDRVGEKTELKIVKKFFGNGSMPKKGTIKREEFEDIIMKHLFVTPATNERTLTRKDLNDSEDLFIDEAMQECALDDKPKKIAMKTPSKREFFPLATSARRRPSSLDAIQRFGDKFSIDDKSNDSYRFKYRAQQRKKGGGSKKNRNNESAGGDESNCDKHQSDDELSD